MGLRRFGALNAVARVRFPAMEPPKIKKKEKKSYAMSISLTYKRLSQIDKKHINTPADG